MGEFWQLEGYDTFSAEPYRLGHGVDYQLLYDSDTAAYTDALRRLDELDRTQPDAGGQGPHGIQDQVWIVHPDGQRERITRLRALTIQQPYAFAVAYGGKTVENRGQRMGHRGPLAIHAGIALAEPGFFPTRTPEGHAAAQAFDKLGGRNNLWDPRQYIPSAMREPPHPGLALGAVIAVADVTGCHRAADCGEILAGDGGLRLCTPWAMPGCWHIQLAKVRPLPAAVPARGMPGLWTLPNRTATDVRLLLAEVPR
jgi:hypothetical protein